MLIRNVWAADRLWRNAKKDAGSRARIAAAREVEDYLNARDAVVRLAFEAGVPQLRIGRDGLGTTASQTITDSLKRTAPAAALLVEVLEADSLASHHGEAAS
jgi:hypothetical protein